MDLREHFETFKRSVRSRRELDPAIPVLPGTPFFGSLGSFRDDAFATITRAGELGDLVRVNLAYRSVCIVKHPEAAGAVLDAPGVWERNQGLVPLIGKNVLTTNGEEWTKNRQFAQPSFHPKMAARAAASFARDAAEHLDGWARFAEEGTTIDLGVEAGRLFARAATRSFGLSLRPDEAAAFPDVLRRTQRWGFRVISGGERRTREVEADLDFLDRIIARSIETPAAPDEPPSYLERLRQDHEVERDALRGHLMLMLIAAADNPPNVFAFTGWLLANHPAQADAARAEVLAVAGGELPDADMIDAMPLLDRIVKEAMRLYPPVWIVQRVARTDTQLLGYRIPADTMAIVVPWLVHRHPSAWERPEEMQPDRFLPEHAEKRHRHAYLPFGTGPRSCIGQRLATLEVKTTLALFLQRYRAHATARTLELEGTFNLRARDGVFVKLERRAG